MNRHVLTAMLAFGTTLAFARECTAGDPPGMAVDPLPKSVVFDVAFSPDGKLLALACEDKVVRIYDWPSGKERTVLEGHTTRVWAVAISPDGKSLASCTGEYSKSNVPGELKIWDLETGKEKATLKGHTALIYHVVFSPDGKTLLSCGHDSTVRVWNTVTFEQQAALKGHKGVVRGVAYAPGGSVFASIGFDGAVRVMGADSLKLQKTWIAHEGGVQHVLFSPDGAYLATASQIAGTDRGEVKLWDFKSGELLATYSGTKSRILKIDFTKDGATLAVGGGYYTQFGEVMLIELASGRVRANFPGHTEWVEGIRFTPDGQTLVSAGGFTHKKPAEVRAWPLADLRKRKKQGPLDADEVQALWNDLASQDAGRAYKAVLELSAAPAEAISLFKAKLRPAQIPDPKLVGGLIAKLDHDDFDVREEANKELAQVADLVQAEIKKANLETKSAEVKNRTGVLLRNQSFVLTSSELLRSARAVEVLEAIATPEAQQLLETLAAGTPVTQLSTRYRAAIERMKNRREPAH